MCMTCAPTLSSSARRGCCSPPSSAARLRSRSPPPHPAAPPHHTRAWTSMAEYSELAQLVRELKLAAIDAYMRTQPYPWTINGDQYEINSSGTHTKVTRPGPDGEGGGDWSSDNFIAEW